MLRRQKNMPRPKKVASTENLEDTVTDSPVEVASVENQSEEKPPEQILVPFYIKAVKSDDEDDMPIQMSMTVTDVELLEENQEVLSTTKFEVYSNGEYVETVDENSSELRNYLDLNRLELDNRIHELWQTPNDPNDLIFFNFGIQQMNYNSYAAYFNVNGFAPVEPKIKSWMEYYLRIHNPVTPEEIAIQLKGSLQYSFIPIKS